MTSFLRDLKSTLLDSPNSKKMPSRRHPNEDPLKRINSWDDGYDEYMRGADRSQDGTEPQYSPPLNTPSAPPYKPSRRSAYEPDYVRERHAYNPTPPRSDPDTPRRHQHSARRSPSPRRRESRREGDRHRDDGHRHGDDGHAFRRPHLDHPSHTAPVPRTRDLRHGGEDPNSRSASPREQHDDRRHHRRSPSPPRRANSARYGDHHRHARDSHHDARPHMIRRPSSADGTRYRSPSPPSSGGHSSGRKSHPPRAIDTRPHISRSMTTSAAAAATSAKDRLAHLSPRWQKAAQAALQAGSITAFQLRKSPGAWKGEKGAKVATAALGAAAINAFLKNNDDNDKDRDRDSRDRDGRSRSGKREKEGGGTKERSDVGLITDAVGGFLVDQFSKRK